MHRLTQSHQITAPCKSRSVCRANFAQNDKIRSILYPRYSIGHQTLQRQKQEHPPAIAPSAATPLVSDVLRSAGRPLSPTLRDYFEPRFGQDFSRVRVHTDPLANASSRNIGARAYTHGSHIVFGSQEYRPETLSGRRLLAHELTHVVQQSQVAAIVQRDPLDGEEDLLGQQGRAEDEARQTALDMADAGPQVYMCSKELDTSPLGSHAFFRTGAPGKHNPTFSLQPIDSSLGADCWQGIPDRNYPSDYNVDGDCDPVAISESCLEQEYRAYPIGHYCTWGPNSNTFVGVVARNCGIANPDPPGWTPGIGESAPPSGTYAPDKWTTLAGCQTKQCIIGPDDPGSNPTNV
ncbi:MAG: DUF4157 domain-containing protein [Gammaproteobacteria bacterium]|nr:DUF4157 domain-containing protein [Gammaproteobacteria bacterium]